MATYWKSQPRKMCEYCKCWITDNKPSVEFHERGKKHQENVKKKLDELRKKGLKDAQSQQTLHSDLAAIEKAALEALKKDITSDPSMAAQYGLNIDTSKPVVIRDIVKTEKKKKDAGEWYEAVSPEGYTYYWNTVSLESRWEAPDDFVSLAKQQNESEKEENSEQTVESAESAPQVAEQEEEEKPAESSQPQHSAYGKWQTVREEQLPDLNLPNNPYEFSEAPAEDVAKESDAEPSVPEVLEVGDIPLPSDIPLPVEYPEKQEQEPPKSRFKEKRVLLSDTQTLGANVGFKKRKLNSGNRSLRQKRDDD